MSHTSSPTLHPSIPVSKLPSTTGDSLHMSKQPTLDSDKGMHDSEEHHAHPLAQLSQFKKNFLLVVFSVATFLDVCNISGVALAIAKIRVDLGLEVNQIAWIITSYSLCFAAFLLFAGRLSDLFPATIIFEVGFSGLGVISLITSFVTTNKYGFLILRGLGGLCGALTIPSSYHLLVHMFPSHVEQQKKLGLLGMAAGLGNVLGLVIAGLAMLASYHWFFRIVAILSFIFSGAAILLLPRIAAPLSKDRSPKWKRLDIIGVLLMMAFLICFILSLTNGPVEGWGSAAFIAPFVISFVAAIGFFVWEWSIPAMSAVLPSSVYQIKNFIPSSLAILIPMAYWTTSQIYYASYFQLAFGWSPILVAAAILPQGIMCLIVGAASQGIPQIVGKPQFTVPIGVILVVAGELLQIYSYGGQGTDYWRFIFPGFILGSTGSMIIYFASAINIVVYAPPEMSGVISAWVQVSAQVGGAVALAVQAAFETDDMTAWMQSAGRTFWLVLAWAVVLGLQFIVFWRRPGTPAEEHELARERIAKTGKGEGVTEMA